MPSAPSQPTTPSPTPVPTIPPPVEWSITGRVIGTATGEPVGGATVSATDGSATFTETTNSAGRFTLRRTPAPAGRLTMTVTSDGYLTRNTYVGITRTADVTIDLIRQSAPFDLKYYQALARDGDEGTFLTLAPWTRDARFYVRTVDDTGRTLEPEVLAILQDQLPKAFRAWTNNARNATVDSGTGPAPTNDSSVVSIRLVRGRDNSICGSASVGLMPGSIEFNVDYCACGSKKIASATIWHEVGHVAGFWHVQSRDAVMFPYVGPVCTTYDRLSSAEQFHASIMYRRPRGNQDPDTDPLGTELLRPPSSVPPIIAN